MSTHSTRFNLREIATHAMVARDFLVGVPPAAQQQLQTFSELPFEPNIQDRSAWLWSSIDNDDSKDLDQVEYVEETTDGVRIYVGIADVDRFVSAGSPLDRAASHNTTSVYTGVVTFPMLPEHLSTDLSSLNEGQPRAAIVIEMLITPDGRCAGSTVYRAIVQNKAQLTYDAVADWLDGNTNSNHRSPEGIATLQKIEQDPGLQRQLKLQDQAATALRTRRHEAGALTFHTSELQPILSSDGSVVDVKARQQNRASFLIEDLMIASNQATATFLDQHGLPSVRRIVRDPERWERIVDLAASKGGRLPAQPDAVSLEEFLKEQQKTDPAHFTELSFSIIKLLGRGEYALKSPGQDAPGHFGLAVRNYAHSTAPNRRYPDLLTQRLLKAAFAGKGSPYPNEQLDALAKHCTEKENDANKVERFVKKCAAAIVLMSRVGETFQATISGRNAEGTWVRLSHPPVEGRLNGRFKPMDVGQRLDVRLAYVNPEKGFIDFELPGGA